MLKHKIRILFCGKISHVYLKSSNFRRVGPVNQFKSIYKIIERGEGGSQKKLRGLGGLYRSICQNPRSSVHKLHSQSRKLQQTKTNNSLCFRMVTISDIKTISSFSSSFRSLQLVMNYKVNYCLIKSKVQIKTKKPTRCNNRDDLLHLRFTLKISIFLKA